MASSLRTSSARHNSLPKSARLVILSETVDNVVVGRDGLVLAGESVEVEPFVDERPRGGAESGGNIIVDGDRLF
jgi:hypothetical protein